MKYLPYENITYITNLKQEEILKRLNDIIVPTMDVDLLPYNQGNKPYEGKIETQYFKIKRNTNYKTFFALKNPFQPIINGEIEQDAVGTTIKVKMRLNVFVFILICISFGIPEIAFIAGLATTGSPMPPVLIPFMILFFIYIPVMLGFKFESQQSKKDLQKVFDATVFNS